MKIHKKNCESFTPFELVMLIETKEDFDNLSYLAKNIEGWGNGSTELGRQLRAAMELTR